MNRKFITPIFWGLLIIVLIVLGSEMRKAANKPKELKYSELTQALKDNEIKTITIQEGNITGTFNEKGVAERETEKFQSYGYVDPDMLNVLEEKGVAVEFKAPEEMPWWQLMLIYSLPFLIMIPLLLYYFQSHSSAGRGSDFGKSRAKLVEDSKKKVTFADVAGIDEAKEELTEIVDFLMDPHKFTRLGGKIPRGVLLMGPPGTGKTLLARSIAGEAGVPFYSISGSDFVEMYVGVGASRVRSLFEQAKRSAPCLVFIDEIDAVGRHRGTGVGGGNDEREQTLNQLLVEMDGFEGNEGVILIAATNRPDVLDPALLRPGRFDRRVTVLNPDIRGREGILKVHTRKTPLGEDVDLKRVAKGTSGFSGADLANMVNEAALAAAKRSATCLLQRDFEEAIDKVLMGRERRSMVISEKEKRNTAFHEAGHALISILLHSEADADDAIHKITIVPRGQALGLVATQPAEDRLTLTKEWALNKIAMMMGGRVAEELVFGRQTTGAGNDFEQATRMARKMVTEWGMSDKVGPMAVGADDEHPFLGRDMYTAKNHSEFLARTVDEEIQNILLKQYNKAKQLLSDNYDKLTLIAEALIEYETIDGRQCALLLEKGKQALADDIAAQNNLAASYIQSTFTNSFQSSVSESTPEVNSASEKALAV